MKQLIKPMKNCCEKNKNSLSKNLLTGLCGSVAVQTLLHLTFNISDISFEKIVYKNSGDVPQGDKNRVVGYWAIAVNRKNISMNITSADKSALLKIARDAITGHLTNTKNATSESEYPEILNEKYGAFVTLKKEGKLRGCIGRFKTENILYLTIKEMAIAAATRDSRFNPVTTEELEEVEIEISILTPLKLINSIDQVQLGKHGIYIKKGINSGTFLPQVALEANWTKEEFLGYCARDKARIGWEGWKTAALYTYEAIVFSEK
jgi:AmmeMemoRadiSam system protein A